MMRMMFVVVSILLASGCAKKYCEQERGFEQAREYPPLTAPQGMDAPGQDPSLQIPTARGDASSVLGESRPCLEIPPRMRAET